MAFSSGGAVMKTFTIAVLLVILCTVLQAADYVRPDFQLRPSLQNIPVRYIKPAQARPDTLVYQFSITPINLLHSYYDYMIGSYNNLPLWVNPDPAYGGYFMTFHGKRTSTGQRRFFYSYIDDNGVIENMTDPPWPMVTEGYPSLAMDDVARKPLYAWHGNYDGDIDPNLEVVFAYDAYLFGAAGLLSDPQIIIDNPITMPPPYNTTVNEFNWPTVQTGPSPITGMRRVYVLARNVYTHSVAPSENVRIAYADYTAQMLESNATLTWSYTTIPLLDAWNHDQSMHRRMAGSFLAGDDGKIYYVGYHTTFDALTDDLVEEPDVDVFVCDNFGEGVWTRITADSRYQGWNPHENFGIGDGYFKFSDEVTPVPDSLLKWKIMNSRNFNAVIDENYNRIHMPALWSMYFTETNDGVLHQYYFPSFHNVKDLVFDINSQQFSIREVYPQAGSAFDNLLWQPWDADGDGMVDEYYNDPNDPNDPLNGTPLMQTTWPFPHWDATLHNDTMMHHYSHLNITQPDQYGNMAMVWQESHRAHCVNILPDQYPWLAPFIDTPEIMISYSPDWGFTWSEPISLNKVETPELAGMKPMWVYPVNQVKGLGGNTQGFEGKLAMLFYDDVDWGSYVLYPPVPVNGEGYVRFMELLFAPVQASDEQTTPHVSFQLQNHPNPFSTNTGISFTMYKSGWADLSIYNVKGQLIKNLCSGLQKKGETTLVWDKTDQAGRAVSGGIYYFRLKAQGRAETKKMLLLK